jgi:hypothetical protein
MTLRHARRDELRTIETLRDRGALFVISHSAGKDSQAQTILVRSLVPAAQIVVVHARFPKSSGTAPSNTSARQPGGCR